MITVISFLVEFFIVCACVYNLPSNLNREYIQCWRHGHKQILCLSGFLQLRETTVVNQGHRVTNSVLAKHLKVKHTLKPLWWNMYLILPRLMTESKCHKCCCHKLCLPVEYFQLCGTILRCNVNVFLFPLVLGGELTGSSGTIVSPNFPSFYSDDLNVNWLITVESDYFIRVDVTSISIEAGAGSECPFDTLKVGAAIYIKCYVCEAAGGCTH